MNKKSIKIAFALVLSVSTFALTGCGGSTKHKDKKTDTSNIYSYTANCNGGNVASGHTNQITLTKASGSKATVSLNDFCIDVGGDAYRVTPGKDATWSGTPAKGGNTSVTGLYWCAGSSRSSCDGSIHWDSLDLDGDNKYEGSASFYY